jgi:hypothetical protein
MRPRSEELQTNSRPKESQSAILGKQTIGSLQKMASFLAEMLGAEKSLIGMLAEGATLG